VSLHYFPFKKEPELVSKWTAFVRFRDWVWSVFEYHCAGCYNLPFNGVVLVPVGANLLRIYYLTLSNAEKVCEFEFWKSFIGTIFCGVRFL
jgi:hypothetical protein